MRDALLRVSAPLTGSLGATVNSPTITLPSGGMSIIHPMLLEINYPANPTGTSPSVIADIYHSANDSTYTLLERVHDVDAATTGYPKLRRRRFMTTKHYIQVKFTLNNTDNVYGTPTVAVSQGASLGHKEV